MGSFPIKLGSQPYTFYKFLKCLLAPNNCFAKYCINRRYIAFNQNANKTFPNFKTKCVVSFYFEQAFQPSNFYKFLGWFGNSNNGFTTGLNIKTYCLKEKWDIKGKTYLGRLPRDACSDRGHRALPQLDPPLDQLAPGRGSRVDKVAQELLSPLPLASLSPVPSSSSSPHRVTKP